MSHFRRQSSSLRLSVSPVFLVVFLVALPAAFAANSLCGTITDPAGGLVPGATVRLLRSTDPSPNETPTDAHGLILFIHPDPGDYHLTAAFPGFCDGHSHHNLADAQASSERIQFVRISQQSESATVTAEVNDMDVLARDPGQRVFVWQDLLDASPGHPGAPVSIPGYPIETPSGGVKAPQHFAPGVAGDHGEPIAQSSRRAVISCPTI